MDYLINLFNMIIHLDKSILVLTNEYHQYIYAILFMVIFCETGLVVTPFLPGDSLLFIAGSIAAVGNLDIYTLIIVIFVAVFLGDNSNFFIGKFIGEHLFKNPKSKIFRQDLLQKTHLFYEKHGRKTIILARFVPLIRTFAPFVAGLGHMQYSKFIGFSLTGSVLWITVLLGGGYWFGNLPIIKTHLSLVIMVIVIISLLPALQIIINELRVYKKTK